MVLPSVQRSVTEGNLSPGFSFAFISIPPQFPAVCRPTTDSTSHTPTRTEACYRVWCHRRAVDSRFRGNDGAGSGDDGEGSVDDGEGSGDDGEGNGNDGNEKRSSSRDTRHDPLSLPETPVPPSRSSRNTRYHPLSHPGIAAGDIRDPPPGRKYVIGYGVIGGRWIPAFAGMTEKETGMTGRSYPHPVIPAGSSSPAGGQTTSPAWRSYPYTRENRPVAA